MIINIIASYNKILYAIIIFLQFYIEREIVHSTRRFPTFTCLSPRQNVWFFQTLKNFISKFAIECDSNSKISQIREKVGLSLKKFWVFKFGENTKFDEKKGFFWKKNAIIVSINKFFFKKMLDFLTENDYNHNFSLVSQCQKISSFQ